MGKTDFYQQDQDIITRAQQQPAKLEAELESVFARWKEREEKT